MSATYKLKFWFEWKTDTALQAANDAAWDKFGIGFIAPERLRLRPETVEQIHFVSRWHDDSLNWDYPPNPSLWRQDECDRFNIAVHELFEKVVQELGPDFEVINNQQMLVEDPDLDEYLKDPKRFRRKQ